MNIIYGIIWGQYTPGVQLVLKGNEDYPTKSKFFDSLWLTKATKNITTVIDVKLNKPASIYQCIQGFINMRQGKNYPITKENATFVLSRDGTKLNATY